MSGFTSRARQPLSLSARAWCQATTCCSPTLHRAYILLVRADLVPNLPNGESQCRHRIVTCVSRKLSPKRETPNMSFGLYILGYLIVIGGLIYAATLIDLPTRWIVAGAIVLAGIGVVTGVKAMRPKDTPS